jgi:hypothetical protein
LRVVAPLLILLSLASWAFATPVGSSPDEDFHLASIWCGAGHRDGLCEPGAKHGQERVPKALITSPCFKMNKTKTADCQDLGDIGLVSTSRVNATAVYPPIYYAAMSIFAGRNVAVSTLTIRLVNAALFIGLAVAMFALLPRERRTGLVLTWASIVVPLGMFVVPSVNPSSWAVTGCATAWFAGLGFFESHGARRIGFGALAALGCFMAAGARADAAVYAVLAVGAAWFAVAGKGRGSRWVTLALPAAAILLAIGFVMLSGQDGVLTNGFGSKHGPTGFGLLFQNLIDVPVLWLGTLGLGSYGSLGWFDISVPFATQAGAIVAFLLVIAWGLRGGSPRRLIVMAFWMAALLAIPLWTLQISHARVGTFLQPRYLYPAVILLVAAAVTIEHRNERPTALQLVALGAAGALANSAALYGAIRRFSIANPTRVDADLASHEKWWWAVGVPGPMTIWIVGSLAFAAAVAILLTYLASPTPMRNTVPSSVMRDSAISDAPTALRHLRGRHAAQ